MIRAAALLLALATLLGGCAAIRASWARQAVRVVKDVRYVAGSAHDKHRLDLYLPRHRRGFPVVHFVHGGWWHSGDKDYYAFFTGLYGSIGIALAERGVGAVVQSYRLSPEVGIEAQIEDVLRAVRWTLEHVAEHGGDPKRLVLAGHSAGGHLIALLGTHERLYAAAGIDARRVRGYVALSPILDVAHLRASREAEFNERVTDRVFGRTAARLAEFSPSTYFRAGLPPFLIAVGAEDHPFLREQARATVVRLRALGNAPEHIIVPGYSHVDMVLQVGGSSDRVTGVIVPFVERVTSEPRR